MSRLEQIPDVCAVVLEVNGGEPRLLTYIQHRDKTVRSRIYSAEREVHEMFSGPAVDFRVISLDTAKCTLPTEDAEGVYVLFRR